MLWWCVGGLIVAFAVLMLIGIWGERTSKREAEAKRQLRAERIAAIAPLLELPALWAQGETEKDVVGESHYQDELNAIMGGENVRRREATLVAEPENPHDPNAVQVVIAAMPVGYLKRADASKYQTLVRLASASGRRIATEAVILGGHELEDGSQAYFGVKLFLVTPAKLKKLIDGLIE